MKYFTTKFLAVNLFFKKGKVLWTRKEKRFSKLFIKELPLISWLKYTVHIMSDLLEILISLFI